MWLSFIGYRLSPIVAVNAIDQIDRDCNLISLLQHGSKVAQKTGVNWPASKHFRATRFNNSVCRKRRPVWPKSEREHEANMFRVAFVAVTRRLNQKKKQKTPNCSGNKSCCSGSGRLCGTKSTKKKKQKIIKRMDATMRIPFYKYQVFYSSVKEIIRFTIFFNSKSYLSTNVILFSRE